MVAVHLKNVRKAFGPVEVLKGIDLTIEDGEFAVFVGPSGCGKSTLLRMICGLDEVSAGTVSIGGEIVNDVPPAKRGIAMVFQSYALYPHMTVAQNMGYALRLAGTDSAEIRSRVQTAAAVLRLSRVSASRLASANWVRTSFWYSSWRCAMRWRISLTWNFKRPRLPVSSAMAPLICACMRSTSKKRLRGT